MIQSRLLRRLGLLAALAAGYFVAGKLGLEVAYIHPSATVVWPPSGLTLAAFLLLGYEVWPAILLGAFSVNITTAGSIATSAAIAAGNTLEGLVGAYLINRFARGHRVCERARDVFKLAGLAALLSTNDQRHGGRSRALLGRLRALDRLRVHLVYLVDGRCGERSGHRTGGAPVGRPPPSALDPGRQALEALALVVCLAVVGLIVFDGLCRGRTSTIRWNSCASRCSCGRGPARAARGRDRPSCCSPARRDLGHAARLRTLRPAAVQRVAALLQAFQGVSAVVILVLAAAVAERTEAVDRLRRLA